MSNNGDQEDYIDQLGRILPWNRPFTSLERILIVITVSTFISIVGCILFCLIWSQSPLRRRYNAKRKLNKSVTSQPIANKNLLAVPPPPSYESIVKSNELPNMNLTRKPSSGTVSDSDGILLHAKKENLLSLNGKTQRSQSARSSLANGANFPPISNIYPSGLYPQINVEMYIDLINNQLEVHLINAEHISQHAAFDDQSEYFIRLQLVNNKTFKKFLDEGKKTRANLSLNTWKKQEEKQTKNFSHQSNNNNNNTLDINERLQLKLNKNDITSTSLRFLLISIDRSGSKDLMLESLIILNPSMIPKHQQTIEFKSFPQIIFGEIYLGISYLPTAERFTLHFNKFRYFYKTDKENNIDVRLTVTLFYNGRRFFQKKIPFLLNSIQSIDYDLNESLTEIVPQNNIQHIFVHFELNSNDLCWSSLLIGECTRYQSDWKKMLDYPRQTHFGWYQFFG